jgi:hypothetical protein
VTTKSGIFNLFVVKGTGDNVLLYEVPAQVSAAHLQTLMRKPF